MPIIPRSEWGARHPDGFRDAPLPAAEVWLHHSVTVAPDLKWIDANGDGVDDDERAAMRQLEDIGQSRFGGGISYTWLVMPSGRIYQGHSVDRQGAHTGGRNDIARAVCFVGDYEDRAPTNAQLDATAWLLQHAKAKGWIMSARLNGGHRDLKATACPGAKAYARIADINRLAAGVPIEEERDMTEEQARQLAEVAARVERIEKGAGGISDSKGIFYRVDQVEEMVVQAQAEILARLDQIAAGNVDYAALANAVADEQYRRQEA